MIVTLVLAIIGMAFGLALSMFDYRTGSNILLGGILFTLIWISIKPSKKDR